MKIFHPCVQFFLFSDKIETLNFNFDGGFDGLARAQLRNVVRRRLGKYETGRVLRFSEFVLLFQQSHFSFSSYVPLLRARGCREVSALSENEFISLDEYVENMKPEQKDIYYLAADSVTSAKNTPFLERLLEKDLEVLFLVDPIDEIAVQNLKSYKEKNFVDISKEDLDLGDKNEEKDKEVKQEFGRTCDWIKKRLGDKVVSVQISNRLSASPCVLVSGKFGWSANMERLMKAQRMGDPSSLEFMRSRRVLEVNLEHPIIKSLHALVAVALRMRKH